MPRKVSLGARGEVEFPILDGSEFEDCEEAFQRLQGYKGGLPIGRDLGAVIDISLHALRRVHFPDLTRDELRSCMNATTLGDWAMAVFEGFGMEAQSSGESVSPSV